MDTRHEKIIHSLLETDQIHSYVAGAADSTKAHESYEVCHKRLGHAPFSKLKCLSQLELQMENNKACVTCPMSKFTRFPYHIRNSKSTSICEMIHMDVWGSYRVPKHKGFRYFLTLVDDCTRTTWVYLLKQKS